MRSFFVLSLIVVGVAARALPRMPFRRQMSAYTDAQILNYALTLEHLENAFYHQALADYDEDAFADAGFGSGARDAFLQIAEHEAEHVAFLSAALGPNATQPCNYSFPYSDPQSFAALSQVLEGVGVSAYVGAAKYITTPAYLEAAGAVLSTEARHASYVAAVINGQAAWGGAFDTPQDLNQVYTLAAAFITSCPSTNPPLPVMAFPALNVTSEDDPIVSGSNITVSYTPTTAPDEGTQLCLAFFTGFDVIFALLTDNQAVVPHNLTAQVYVVVTKNCTAVADPDMLAGPAILGLYPRDADDDSGDNDEDGDNDADGDNDEDEDNDGDGDNDEDGDE
ncbi:ferritin-like domain-containing protein [Mycena filopes]|nr:ferritin-like domain-containing protein [Mycena filopes]